MPRKNIIYKSLELVKFYKNNRQAWKDLYPSERWVFKKLKGERGNFGDVLDVGCACGGLGAALNEKEMLNSYTGIDINRDVIDWARKTRLLNIPTRFIKHDIVKKSDFNLYDTVISLGCADWNIETKKIITSCWEKVKPGGHMVISFRLTHEKGINDIKKSFQYINFSGNEKSPEVANYVVLNIDDTLKMLEKLKPSPGLIGSYGYRGKPSSTARTPYKKIIFSVFYVKKKQKKNKNKVKYELNLPRS